MSQIKLHPDRTKIQDAVFPGVGMKRLIPKLTDQLEYLRGAASKIPVPKFDNVVIQGGSEKITHDWLWPRVGQFFKSNDVILAETGVYMPCSSYFKLTYNTSFQALHNMQ